MPTISLCMIVKNEEETLARCLDSIQEIADEIIIVDTGSTDKTKEIAGKYTDKIYDFVWIDDFSAARNFSFSKATMDYIMWLDADDIILEEDRIKFLRLKKTLDRSVDFVTMKYNTGFDNQGNVTFSYYRERLSKRSLNPKWEEPVHEYLQMSGKIININICITHQKIHPPTKGRNLAIYEKIVASGKELTPRGQYYFARELKDNGRFDEAIEYFNKFLDSGKGWIEDNISACSGLASCYQAKGESGNYLQALFRSFEYAVPRAEACCQIGYHFKAKESYREAQFWFELATKLKKPESSWGFCQEDYWGYIPCMELCVCHYALGNIQEAIEYNNKAATFKPNDPAVIFNNNFFKNLTP
ncbi:MAG: glycosyltransferase [Peptococcaceae bacterium]|nr:glycosyltransferase [Peptococcaceae bacterium]